MGYQIIRQPDRPGTPPMFAVYSSGTDTIVAYDATVDEIINWFIAQAKDTARRQVLRILGHICDGHPELAYYQFTMTWQEALTEDRAHGGRAHNKFTETGERINPPLLPKMRQP